MTNTKVTPPILYSQLVCPECGARQLTEMTVGPSEESFACTTCGGCFAPGPYDCCVFCCFGTVPCPVAQSMPEVCPTKIHPQTEVEARWQGVKPPFP